MIVGNFLTQTIRRRYLVNATKTASPAYSHIKTLMPKVHTQHFKCVLNKYLFICEWNNADTYILIIHVVINQYRTKLKQIPTKKKKHLSLVLKEWHMTIFPQAVFAKL